MLLRVKVVTSDFKKFYVTVVNYSRSMTPTRCTDGARDRTGPMDPRCYAEVPIITKAVAGEG